MQALSESNTSSRGLAYRIFPSTSRQSPEIKPSGLGGNYISFVLYSCSKSLVISLIRETFQLLLSDMVWLTVKHACVCLSPMTMGSRTLPCPLRQKCVHAANSGLNMAAGRALSAILVYAISISKEISQGNNAHSFLGLVAPY